MCNFPLFCVNIKVTHKLLLQSPNGWSINVNYLTTIKAIGLKLFVCALHKIRKSANLHLIDPLEGKLKIISIIFQSVKGPRGGGGEWGSVPKFRTFQNSAGEYIGCSYIIEINHYSRSWVSSSLMAKIGCNIYVTSYCGLCGGYVFQLPCRGIFG